MANKWFQRIGVVQELNRLKALEPAAPKPPKVTIADMVDLRYLSKADVKNLSEGQRRVLINYANSYFDQCLDNNFIVKRTKSGRIEADFEEADAFAKIRHAVELLNTVPLKRV